uniref:Zinc finger protein 443 n=2 Tax=Culex pipiens TaxID=7175 RepID=A0A8D8H5F2_CULPI
MDELDVKPNIKIEAVDWPKPPTNCHHPEVPVAHPDQKPNISNFTFPSVVKEELILEDDNPQFEPASGVPGAPEPVTPDLNQYASAEEDSNDPSSDLNPGKVACTICQLSFPKKRDLQRHQREEHKQLYFCNTCDKSFDKPCRLKRHAPSCKGRPLYCATCDKTFDAVKAWYKHRASHRNVESKKFQCQLCHKPFTARSGSLQHEWEVHKFIRPELADEVTICKMCNKPCYSKDSYEQHLQSHMHIENKTFQCKICEKCFGSENCLKGHTTRQECEKKVMLGANGVYNCFECSKTFSQQIFLIRHMRRHAHIINGTYKCDLCGKHFASNKELQTHTKNFHELRKPSAVDLILTDERGHFKCPKCDTTYENRQSCLKHILRHEALETGKYRCQICGRACTTKVVLEKHLKTHAPKPNGPSELKNHQQNTSLLSNGESSSAAEDLSTSWPSTECHTDANDHFKNSY